jgi:nucleotide-binding universal stress UspA family protein
MYYMPSIKPVVRDPAPTLAPDTSASPQSLARQTALVPFDRSAAARCALDYAVNWAKARGGRIHLLNVQSRPRDEAVFYQSARAEGDRILAAAKAHLDHENIEHSCEVRFGHVASVIADSAVRARCSLIVIGARSRPAFARFFSASVSSEVVRLSPVEVAVVTHRISSSVHAPWRQWRRRNA